jgi:hypothetical protein
VSGFASSLDLGDKLGSIVSAATGVISGIGDSNASGLPG